MYKIKEGDIIWDLNMIYAGAVIATDVKIQSASVTLTTDQMMKESSLVPV